MVRTSQIAQVGRRKVELSNLKKVLWPDDGFVKAELIEYYLQMAPTILSHVRGRLLTLVRFPDGIDGQTFFQKRRPRWAPEWIDYVSLGGEGKAIDYMLLTEAASLVWLANLACIEQDEGSVGVTMSICGVILVIVSVKIDADGKAQKSEQLEMGLSEFLAYLGCMALIAGATTMIYAWIGLLIEFPD